MYKEKNAINPMCTIVAGLFQLELQKIKIWFLFRGLSAIAALLMKRVSQVVAVDIYGATPLHYAAQHNHADCVELVRCRGKEAVQHLYW